MPEQPIVIAHHIMWTLYGWWLPNDLRGSTSHVIRNDLIAELAELHLGREKIQPGGNDLREFYDQAAAHQNVGYLGLLIPPERASLVCRLETENGIPRLQSSRWLLLLRLSGNCGRSYSRFLYWRHV